MAGKYYIIQISYSTKDQVEKDFNFFENQGQTSRPSADLLQRTAGTEKPQRTSRSCHFQLQLQNKIKLRETLHSLALRWTLLKMSSKAL